jgi:peptidoglycan/xylan/chitin deacetylase (PgdA/CDA1 family)
VGSAAPFRVALTFDAEHPDRPARPGNDERLLDALAAAGVKATFFVQGRWAEAFPAVARRISAEGHLVGSHTFYHARLPLLSDEGLATDLRDAEAAILETTGADPRPWLRVPFGTGANDPGLLRRLAELGYPCHVGWHVAPDDWDLSCTVDLLGSRVLGGARAHGDGAVVLLHTWPDPTAEGLPALIGRLGEAGATFVTVDEIDDLPAGVPFGEDE